MARAAPCKITSMVPAWGLAKVCSVLVLSAAVVHEVDVVVTPPHAPPPFYPPGNEDVSKEIEDEEQVLGLQGDEDGPPPPPDPNGQKQDEGLEMQV